AAAEREPGDADARTRPARNRDADVRERGVDVDQPRACADRGRAAGGCDAVEAGDVGDDDAVAARVSGVAVASRAWDDMDAVFVSPADRPLHIRRVRAIRDRTGP